MTKDDLINQLFDACLLAVDALECNCGGPCLGTCSYAAVKNAIAGVIVEKNRGSVINLD